MYCTKCGHELITGSNFCTQCGAPVTDAQPQTESSKSPNDMSSTVPHITPESRVQRSKTSGNGTALRDIDFQGKMKGAANTVFQSGARDILYYVTMAIAILECLLPFFKWLRIPMYDALSNFLSGSSQFSSYSLFGAIGMLSNGSGSGSTFPAVLSLILSIVAVIAIIFNIRFIAKGLKSSTTYYKYGTISALLMLVISVLFLLFMGLVAAFSLVIKITFTPWLALAGAIVNIILIQQLKVRERRR